MRKLLAAALLLIAAPTCLAWDGSVVGVHDGDTITVLDQCNAQHKLRLASIDAPELKQPYGNSAKQELSAMVFGKIVDVEDLETDRYGRTIAVVTWGGINVNRALVRDGAAWAYIQYLRDPEMIALQNEAKTQQRGLWALQADQIQEPWEFRRKK